MLDSNEYIISFDSPRLGYGKVSLKNPDKSGLPSGITAIVGLNGSGKTTLGTILEKGRYAYGNRLGFSDKIKKVKLLTFTDIHSLTGIDVQYYNQRMEATMNEYVPTVDDIFGIKTQNPLWESLTETFKLKNISYKKINYLSSGELRKLLIINALTEEPDLLILDNPYIGLDHDSRKELDDAMIRLRSSGISVVFLLCDFDDIPLFTDSIIHLEDCKINKPICGKNSINNYIKNWKKSHLPTGTLSLPALKPPTKPECSIVFSIEKGCARYGDKIIFDDFNWIVRKGECWALTGPNGSGKSLLLSMVCADNPQGYANKIILFDRRRGSGESIWEIKDAIGYVCPEMQLYFKSNDSVKEIIVQGLRNSLNRYHPSTLEEQRVAEEWMRILDITHLESKKFSELSSGEQRLVLLARALIKQPDLLVLDEPLHGLDKNHKERIKIVINELIKRNGTSLIYVTHYKSEIPYCVTMEKRMIPA